MKKRDTYRPAVDMVERAMMNPRITLHHQLTMWKNRPPVLSTGKIVINANVEEVKAKSRTSMQGIQTTYHGGNNPWRAIGRGINDSPESAKWTLRTRRGAE